eukprot:2664401-Amphidinium_carterae.1
MNEQLDFLQRTYGRLNLPLFPTQRGEPASKESVVATVRKMCQIVSLPDDQVKAITGHTFR